MGSSASHRVRNWLAGVAAIALAYLMVTYVVLPELWFHYEHQPGLKTNPAVTTTPLGIPGDPLNVGLVGDAKEIIRSMLKAGWFPADPITLRSSLEIAESVILDHPYKQAPVSTLLYEGRKQDMAFEKPIGQSAGRRNHVRLWKVLDHGTEGRQVWLGSATLDQSVGLNEYTGQFTHHISPDIDAERDRLIADLTAASVVIALYTVSGVGPTIAGRNGEGDPYYTDGENRIAVLSPNAMPATRDPVIYADSKIVQVKNGAWRKISAWFSR